MPYQKYIQDIYNGLSRPIFNTSLRTDHDSKSSNIIPENYDIAKPFSIIDIYKKDPCKDEFLKLLLERGSSCSAVSCKWWTMGHVMLSSTLRENIYWLIQKGFLRKKERQKIRPGMIIEEIGSGDKWLVDEVLEWIKIGTGKY